MAREATITLDGTEFVVPALNIAQLQEVAEIINAGNAATSGFSILKIAMRRATPSPDFEILGPTLDEIATAVEKMLKLSGLQKPDSDPQLRVVPKQSN